MTTSYFRLLDDIDFRSRWYLGAIVGADNWKLADGDGNDGQPEPRTISVYQSGREMDYTTTGIYSDPVASAAMRKALEDVSGTRFLEAQIVTADGEVSHGPGKYFVMLVEDQVDAVDEEASEFEKFVVDDPVRPDLAGRYKAFYRLMIDPAKADGHAIFRLGGVNGHIIIDAEVRKRLQAVGATGVVTRPV